MKYWRSKKDEFNTIRLNIDILTICDNKCPYCYSRADSKMWGLVMNDKFLTNTLFPQIENLSKELSKNHKFLDIIILGGEPTLHPQLNRIIDFITTLDNTKVSITSNGNRAYSNISENKNVRWAFTFHPSQVKDDDRWLNNIISKKDLFWEVSVHPMIDCWVSEDVIYSYARRIKRIIQRCFDNNICIQPVFQNNPYSENILQSIDIERIKKYYSFLEELPSYYEYNDTKVNDYYIITNGINNFNGFKCTNNFFSINVCGELHQNCSYKSFKFSDLINYSCKNFICPLEKCICIGFSSLYKNLE
jgi:organic radical activating enzyme